MIRRPLVRARPFLLPLAVAGSAAYVGRDISAITGARSTLAFAFGALLVALSLLSPRRALLALLGWLSVLGLVRRVFSSEWTLATLTPVGDPLLLIHAAVIGLLTFFAVRSGALRDRTRFTHAVLGFLGLLIVSVVNPQQGGLQIGLGGLLLVVVPMLGFLIGRAYGDESFMLRVFTAVAWISVPAAAYGLYQTFAGFPSWDQAWVDRNGYTALSVYGFTRGFGTFSSSAEYGTFLAIGSLCWLGLGRRAGPVLLRAGAIAMIGIAIFYQSSRGILVLTFLGGWLIFAARRRLSLAAALVLAALLLIISPALVAQVAPEEFQDDAGGALARHQVEGLADPLGPDSTLPGHWDRLVDGLRQGLVNPLGSGVGAITIATEKFGGRNVSTEIDVSNVAVAAGLPGLVLYLYLFGGGFRRVYQMAADRASPVGVVGLGVLAATAFQWTSGGQYAVALLPWLVLGWVDRPLLETDPTAVDIDHRQGQEVAQTHRGRWDAVLQPLSAVSNTSR